jgi:predicted AAA+ superfamily ATPase
VPNVDFTASYVRRVVDDELDELLPSLPAVWLDGPKAVGKTETALQRAATVRRLERRDEQEIAAADPRVALLGTSPVLLDEWQRVPGVWDAVKAAVDACSAGGQFLLTGSAQQARTHSGAGRIAALRMRPLTLPERGVGVPSVSLARLLSGDQEELGGESEVGLIDYVREILASGFPGLRNLTGRALRTQLDGYLERVVDTDMEEAGLRVRRPATVRSWLRAYAAATATTASWNAISDAATAGLDNKPAKTSVLPYIDVLSRLRILDELEAWLPSNNHLQRLGQAPKHHLADPALAARLAGVSEAMLLSGQAGSVAVPRDGTFLGALFESLCALSIRVFAQAAEARVSHFRMRDGRHEADLIVEREDGAVVAFEVKLSATVETADVRHLLWLRDTVGDQLVDAAVLTTGSRAYRRGDGVAVVPLALLGP